MTNFDINHYQELLTEDEDMMNDEADDAEPIGIDKLPSGTHDPQIVLNTDPYKTVELLQTILSHIHNVY